MVWPAGTNSLWMMSLLSKKAINSVLILDFYRRLFFGRGEVGEHHVIDCRFESRSHMKMKSPEVSIRFAFYSSVSLCASNQEQIFRLPKSSRTMVCTVFLLMPNSSAINLGVSRRSCARFSYTFSIISGVLLVDDRPERGSLSALSFSLRKCLKHS